jgi:hypothetical protein
MDAFCTTFELFRCSNNVTTEYASHQRKLLCSFFLMGCDGLDMSKKDDRSTHRVARRHAVAKGYFQESPPAGVLPVSMNLGIGYAECFLYIRRKLGFTKFQTLIQTVGLATWQDSTPLEIDSACPGIPGNADGTIKPTHCSRDPCDGPFFVKMIGAGPFPLLWTPLCLHDLPQQPQGR